MCIIDNSVMSKDTNLCQLSHLVSGWTWCALPKVARMRNNINLSQLSHLDKVCITDSAPRYLVGTGVYSQYQRE